MKAQFATFEALIALLFSLSVVAALDGRISAVNHGYTYARANLTSSILDYDLLNNMLHNTTASACLENYVSGNALCIDQYLKGYLLTYRVRSINISVPGENANENASGIVRCFPYVINGLAMPLCVSVVD